MPLRRLIQVEGERLKILDPFYPGPNHSTDGSAERSRLLAKEVNPFCAFTARVKRRPRMAQENAFGKRMDE
jgi:hypothetical protein